MAKGAVELDHVEIDGKFPGLLPPDRADTILEVLIAAPRLFTFSFRKHFLSFDRGTAVWFKALGKAKPGFYVKMSLRVETWFTDVGKHYSIWS